MHKILFAVGVCLLGAGSFEYSRGVVLGMDHVTMRQEGQVRELAGQVLVEAVDGGVLLEDRGGMMWVVEGKDLVERKTDEEPFRRWSAAEASEQLSQGVSRLSSPHHGTLPDRVQHVAGLCALVRGAV